MANSINLSFSAIERSIEQKIPLPTESSSGRDYIQWGTDNSYPSFLYSLYETSATLKSVCDGMADYVSGDAIECNGFRDGVTVNETQLSWHDFIHTIGIDIATFGAFAIHVIRSNDGKIHSLDNVDLRYLRWDKDAQLFYYSESFGSKYLRKDKMVVLPKFIEGSDAPSSILMVKLGGRSVYPTPIYSAAIKSCEIERNIDDFHMSSLDNGFVSSALVNFNGGVPEDEVKEEIERLFNEKFSGHQNAGRVIFSWNDSKETATTISPLNPTDFSDRYDALQKHCRQQIFTAFRANPNLFGVATEDNGFNAEEYEQSFKLFNRTVVKPVQHKICDAVDRIFGTQTINIKPFTLEGNEQTQS